MQIQISSTIIYGIFALESAISMSKQSIFLISIQSLKHVMFHCTLLFSNIYITNYICEARFKRRILHAPNAIQTMHNEEAYLIIYCLNCIRCMQNSTFETGLNRLNTDIWLRHQICFKPLPTYA